MRWHDQNETVKIISNPYYLVKYIDQYGLPVGVVYGWIEISDVWTILCRLKEMNL